MSQLSAPVTDRDHATGNLDAMVTLVEYGDYECSHCGRAHPIVQEILRTMGDKIRFVFRHFPLSEIHPHALHAAVASEFASDNGKFWEMHDVLFEKQQHLHDSDIAQYAEALGLDRVDLSRAVESEELFARVNQDFSTGIRSGVNGTPTFFLNGVRHDVSWEYDVLVAALTEVLGH